MTEIDLTDGNDKGRHVQPQGFVPSHLAAPMLRDSRATALEYAASTLGAVRAAADILAGPVEDEALRTRLTEFVSTEATRMQRLVKALATGALVAAFLAAGLVVAGPSAGRAQAAEAPQPDPIARVVAPATYRVVDTARPVVNVRATTYNVTPEGLHCASVWATSPRLLSFGPAHLGSACSISSTFIVRVVLDGAALPLGRSTVVISDDAAPLAAAPAQAILDVRRASKFGRGVWTDAGQGYLTIAAPLQAYSPAAGRWLPQNPPSRVRVLQLVGGRWVVKAILTARNGMAYGAVRFTAGAHVVVKVDHPADAKSWATSGMAHAFDLSPSDPPTDVI